MNADLPCDENKCRTVMEELKQKILNLQEELCQVHEEYSCRISRLESEVCEVRKENLRVCGQRAASEHELTLTNQRTSELMTNCRTTEGKCAELSTQLSIERRKVAELETRLKAANISDRVNKTIEDHLTNINDSQCCSCAAQKGVESFQSTPTKSGTRLSKDGDMSWSSKIYHDDGNVFKTPDDSGYLDTRSHDTSEDVGINNVNKELMKRIVELQKQVDSMKITGATELPEPRQRKPSNTAGISNSVTPTNSLNGSTVEQSGNKIINHHQPNENGTPMPENRDPDKPELGSGKPKLCTSFDHGTKPEIPSGEQNLSDKPMSRMSADRGTKTPEIPPGEQVLSMLKDQERNQSHSKRELEMMPDQTAKASGNAAGRLNRTEPEERPSKSEIIFGSPNSVNDDNRRPDTVNTIPGKQQISWTKDRRPSKLELNCCDPPVLETNECGGLNNTDKIFDTPKTKTTEERRPSSLELGFGTGKLLNKRESLSGKPEIYGTESMPSTSKFGYIIPDTPSHDYREPKKTEAVPGNLQILENQGMLGPEILYGIRQSDTSDGPDKTEEASGKPPNDVKIMPGKWPMTESLAAKMTELEKPTDEGCQHCPACSYETECATRLTVASKTKLKTNGLETKTGQAIKNDQHNSLQIPGPIPTGENDKDWKKKVFKHLSGDKKIYTQKHKDKPKQRRESINRDTPIQTPQAPQQINENSEPPATVNLPDVPILQKDQKSSTNNEPLVLQDVSQNNYYRLSRDSIEMPRRRSFSHQNTVMRDSRDTPVSNVSMQNYYQHSDVMINTAPLIPDNSQEQGTQVPQKMDETAQEQTPQTIPAPNNKVPRTSDPLSSRRTSMARKRDVSMYRRHSGTLCFRTLPPPAADDPRTCHCKDQFEGKCVGKPRNKGIQVHGQDVPLINYQRKCSTSEQGTYTVDSKQCRSTSPDNTDFEISYLSDLPLEKNEKIPSRNQPSPGEDKTASTQTDTSTSPITTNYSLSEGEVPPTYTRRISQNHAKDHQENAFSTSPVAEPSQKMEAALQAITDELARCKTLLSSQRPAEVKHMYKVM